MIRKKVTFVIGAGTGYDINMPLGKDLAKHIADALIDDNPTGPQRRVRDRNVMASISRNFQQQQLPSIFAAAPVISNGIFYANSIDDFLESHLNDESVVSLGKLCIAQKILDAEKASLLFVDPSSANNLISGRRLENTWYSIFGKILFSGLTPAELPVAFQNLRFINFNYDRCLEQFLTFSIASRFNIELLRAAKLVETIPVVHPYGSLGEIGYTFSHSGLRFGGNDSNDPFQISRRIFTYSEQLKPTSHQIQKIQDAMFDSEIIVFLGFAFHEPNMNLLKPVNGSTVKTIIGTSVGMSPLDIEDVSNSLKLFCSPLGAHKITHNIQVSLRDLNCADLLTQHQRMLSD